MTTTGTLETREARLHQLLDDVTQFSGTARTFLDDNGDNLIRLGEVSRAQLRVLARYSTEFPCLLGGIVNAGKLRGRGVPRLHPAHRARDAAEPAARLHRRPTSRCSARTAARPACTCPTRPGTSPTRSAASPTSPTASTPRPARAPTGSARRTAPTASGVQLGDFGGYAGSPEESDLLDTLLAPALGTTADQVPDLGGLLLGPMVRGATVSSAMRGGETP